MLINYRTKLSWREPPQSSEVGAWAVGLLHHPAGLLAQRSHVHVPTALKSAFCSSRIVAVPLMVKFPEGMNGIQS